MTDARDCSKLITPSKYHRTLNGTELVKWREAIGLTQAEFAERCGWSQQQQSRFETPYDHEIHISTVELILQVLGS